MAGNILLTPAALLDLLTQIDELSEYDISITENSDSLQLNIGSSAYTVGGTINEVTAPAYTVADVSDINDDTYSDLQDSGVADISATTVNAGVIKELAKTLLVGGLVRLTTKLLRR